MLPKPFCRALGLGAFTIVLASGAAFASSHKEAPFITSLPKADGADFYMFNSYEKGRQGYVTLIADYIPLQDPNGGPNFGPIDPEVLYRINIDNSGAGQNNLTFEFQFQRKEADVAIPVGGKMVAIPLINAGVIKAGDNSKLNVHEFYKVNVYRGGDAVRGGEQALTSKKDGTTSFEKPVDNIGVKSIPDYKAYADQYIYEVNIPGCNSGTGKVFVGQRKDPFSVNLGEVFDLANLKDPLGNPDQNKNSLAGKNITSFILEVPAACIAFSNHVIGAWTTALMPRGRVGNQSFLPKSKEGKEKENESDWVQVSRLGMPLVNELVIGLKDKDKFNASEPKNDAQFIDYVTNPTFPELVGILFASAGVKAPNVFPRADLVQVFLTGIPGLNANGAAAEMLRLNVTTPVKAAADQKPLGVIDGDVAGFPNGRRPGDDIVDITLRVAMGKLLPLSQAPSGQLTFTDGAFVDASKFDSVFPYLRAPLAGDPQPMAVVPTTGSNIP